MNFHRAIVSTIFLALASAAGAQPASTPAKNASAAKPALPIVNAEVRKIDPDKGTIALKHGDIPNLGMPGMTMQFDVADKKMLKGIKAGDKVRFQADMVQGKATVTSLERVPGP